MVALCISYPSLCISSCYLVAPWMRSTTHLVFFLSLSLSLSLTVSSFSLSDSLFFLSLLTLSLPVFFGICLCVSGLVFSISVAFLPFRFSAFPRIHFTSLATSLPPPLYLYLHLVSTASLLHLYCIYTWSLHQNGLHRRHPKHGSRRTRDLQAELLPEERRPKRDQAVLFPSFLAFQFGPEPDREEMKTTGRTHAADALAVAGHLGLPRRRRKPARLDGNDHRPRRDAVRRAAAEAVVCLPAELPVRAADGAVQDAHLPSQRGLCRPHLFGYPQGSVECRVQRAECVVEFAEFTGRA